MKLENKKNNSDHLNEYDFKKLKLKFLDKDEINIFSTLCQDGIFSIEEIIFNQSDKILLATFSRFCWELVEKKIKENRERNHHANPSAPIVTKNEKWQHRYK